ncbi:MULTISPECIES: hypothetical protein [Brevibacterium]|uniref:hypothetical protein n=1 Tax=Brevibacterium TaxID=1696 RepID=UPI0013C2B828|nr:hypothetical protein [Brevibacterium casei]
MTEHGNIVGSILQLQAQRLTTIDQRTKATSASIDELTEQIRQLAKAQALIIAQLRKES